MGSSGSLSCVALAVKARDDVSERWLDGSSRDAV